MENSLFGPGKSDAAISLHKGNTKVFRFDLCIPLVLNPEFHIPMDLLNQDELHHQKYDRHDA